MGFRLSRMNSGSSSGPELWRFNATAPGTNIELNTAEGVTGIVAPFPGDSEIVMILSEPAPGQKIGGFGVYESPTKIMYSGARKTSGDKSAVVLAQDVVSGEIALFFSRFNGLGNPYSGIFISDAISAECRVTYETTQADCVIENSATGDSSQEQQTVGAKEINIFKAGVEVFRLRIDENGFALYNNAGANLLLQIADTGEILTNQTEAATGADDTIIGRVPYYDEAGILIGYAPLMVDP